jgi:hypothetical protein
MRWNMLSATGILISAASVAVMWVPLFFWTFGFGSSDTEAQDTLRVIVRASCVLCWIGLIISIITPLGALLNFPGLVIAAFYFWVFGSDFSFWTDLFVVSTAGTGIMLTSMFIQLAVFEPTGTAKALPRFRSWVAGPKPENGRLRFIVPKMSKRAQIALFALLAVCVTVTASTYVYVTSENVSTIDIEVVADIWTYGAIHVAVYVDGVSVIDTYLEPDPLMTNESNRHAFVTQSVDVTAGAHMVTAECTNATSGEPIVVHDCPQEARVIPMMVAVVRIGIGVAWA